MDNDFERVCRSKDIVAEVSFFLCSLDSSAQRSDAFKKLAAAIDEGTSRSNSIARKDHALDELMWVVFDEKTVFEGSRLAFVAVADEVLVEGRIFRDKAP